MRLFLSYVLAAWLAELIILMIRWKYLRELGRASGWWGLPLGILTLFLLGPIVRPVSIATQNLRRVF